jgi:hypothetical protein
MTAHSGEPTSPEARTRLTPPGPDNVPDHAATAPAPQALPPLKVPAWVRYLDLVVLAAALPIFLLADLPLLGWATGAGAWLLQRLLQEVVQRRADKSRDPRTVVGLLAGSMIARGWLVALTILLVGLGENDAGLAAALLVISLFTIHLTVQMIARPLEKQPPTA